MYSAIKSPMKSAVCALLFGMLLSRTQAQVGPPPIIVVQPLDQIVLNGGTALFSVTVASVTHVNYKWRYNGVAISGASNNALTIANVDPSDVGNYSVEVKNSGGTVYSRDASLTVLNPPPIISSATMTTSGFRLQVSAAALSTVIISASTNTTDWTPIQTNFTVTGTVQYTDTSATNRPLRYYRVGSL